MKNKKKIEKQKITKNKSVDVLLYAQVILLCLSVFLAPLIAGRLAATPSLVIQLIVLASTGIWIYRLRREGAIDLPGRLVRLLISIFALLITASLIISVNRGATLRELLNIGSYLLVFLVTIGLRQHKNSISAILGSLCLSAMVVGLTGLNEYITTASPGWRTFSTFFNPDFLAGFAAMMLPVTLAWYLSKTSPGVSAITGLWVLLTFTNLLLTGSRLGFIAAMGGLILFAILSLITGSIRKPQLLKFGFLVIPIILVFMIMSTPLKARMGSVQAVKAESHSGNFRVFTWKGAVKMAMANPILGTGLGTFEDAYPKYAIVGFTKLAHNSYLQIAGEAGPAAAGALFVLLMASGLPVMWSLIKKRINSEAEGGTWRGISWMPDTRIMVSGLIAGVAASMARNAVDSDWYITGIGIGFWALAGAVVSFTPSAEPLPVNKRTNGISLAVIGLAAIYGIMLLVGELWCSAGDSQWMSVNPQAARVSYLTAQKVDPLNADYHRRLGMLQMTVARSMGDLPSAERSERQFLASIKLAPASSKGYYQLGKTYALLDRGDDAVDMYKKALDRDPQSPQLLLTLAKQYESMGRKSDALLVYKRMVSVEESPYETVRAIPELVEPAYAFAHAAAGRDLELKGETLKAQNEYQIAMQRIDNYQKSIEGMGEILDAGGSRNQEMEVEIGNLRGDLQTRLDRLSH